MINLVVRKETARL